MCSVLRVCYNGVMSYEIGHSIVFSSNMEPERPHRLYDIGTYVKFVPVTFMDSVQKLNLRST